jgi:hypothetical protein
MEPSGRNRWRPVANATGPTGPEQVSTLATNCHRWQRRAHGKEGVDGSSPSEGFAKAPDIGAFFVGVSQRSRLFRAYGVVLEHSGLLHQNSSPRSSGRSTHGKGRRFESVSAGAANGGPVLWAAVYELGPELGEQQIFQSLKIEISV